MKGFTLIELLVTLAVLVVSLTIGIPIITGQLERQRLIGAAEIITRDLYRARAESLRRSQDVLLSFSLFSGGPPRPWCYGLSVDDPCDCASVDSCRLARELVRRGGDQPGAAYPAVHLDDVSFTADQVRFSPARGLANAGTIRLSSQPDDVAGEYRLAVVVSTLGRIRICTPAGDFKRIGRYPSC